MHTALANFAETLYLKIDSDARFFELHRLDLLASAELVLGTFQALTPAVHLSRLHPVVETLSPTGLKVTLMEC